MKKDPKIFLQHILESIAEIEKYTKDISEKDARKILGSKSSNLSYTQTLAGIFF